MEPGGPPCRFHDWTRVTAGTWHEFHLAWIAEVQLALNGGLSAASYYAQAEQIAGPMGPDVLTLQSGDRLRSSSRSTARAAVWPWPRHRRERLVEEAEMNEYVSSGGRS